MAKIHYGVKPDIFKYALPCVQLNANNPPLIRQQIVHISSAIRTSHCVHVVQICEQDLPFSEFRLHCHQNVENRPAEQKGHEWIPLIAALCLVNLVPDACNVDEREQRS